MKIKVFQIHKRSSYVFKDIQDKYAIQNNIYAISDGATQGFMSQIWAEQLVNDFVSKPEFNITELIHHLEKLARNFNNREFKLDANPAIKAIQERKKQEGASATFMGVKIGENNLKYISSGDVCGVVKKKDQLQFFPFQSVDVLNKDKGFLGTLKLSQGEVAEEQFRTGNIAVFGGDIVILMTDAIAKLVLKKQSILDEILSLESLDSFKLFIINLWETKQLEEDDITIMCIENTDENRLQEFLTTELEFPKEKLPDLDFDPTIGGMTPENYYRLQNEINHLKNELYKINRLEQYIAKLQGKLRLALKVVIAIILGGILGIGVFYIYKKIPSSWKRESKKHNDTKLIISQDTEVVKEENIVKNHSKEEPKAVSIQSKEENGTEDEKTEGIVENIKSIFNKRKDSISSQSHNKNKVKNDEATIKTKQK